MDCRTQFDALLRAPEPILALAPMQDVTNLPFWNLMAAYGGADVYFTEYFRVHPDSRPEKWIVDAIRHNPTGRPIVAQLIGNDIPAMVRTARRLQQYPIAAIDLNLGCPMPVVYRKHAGGGLLRDPERIDAILGGLREAVEIKFSVKTRIGFSDPAGFDKLLAIFAKHAIDLLTVHGRTVAEAYRGGVHYEFITRAATRLPFPVLANGNIDSARKAAEVLALTGARGLMIGRGAIRNPWIFQQIRQYRRGEPVFQPTGRDVLAYVRALQESLFTPGIRELSQVYNLKKYMGFIGLGVEPTGRFLHDILHVSTHADFFRVCEQFLDHDEPMALEPFPIPFKAEGMTRCGDV